jgi:aerobic C4-dicarboxylate transport protein
VPAKPLPIYRQLYFQVIVAIVLGAILGHYEPLIGEKMKPLGDAFIKLVKMIIAPVIFLTIVTGIAGMRTCAPWAGCSARPWRTSCSSPRWR